MVRIAQILHRGEVNPRIKIMDTIVKRAPSETEIKDMVDELITPESADREAKVLIRLLMASTCEDDPAGFAVAQIASRHAYTKTAAFERAVENGYREFIGFPVDGFNPGPDTIEIAGQTG